MVYTLIVSHDNGDLIAEKTGKFEQTSKGRKLPYSVDSDGHMTPDINAKDQTLLEWFAGLFMNYVGKGNLKTYTTGRHKGKDMNFKVECFVGNKSLLNWVKPKKGQVTKIDDFEADL